MSGDFDALPRLLRQSAIGRLARALFNHWRAATATSTAARVARDAVRAATRWSPTERAQTAGIGMATFAAACMIFTTWMPRYAAPGVPMGFWGALAFVGLGVALMPAAFARAWTGSVAARLAARVGRCG